MPHSDPYKLPDGVTLPKKYTRTVTARRYFIEGAQDGAAGRPVQYDEWSLITTQGLAAWNAYLDGHNAGKAIRDEMPASGEASTGQLPRDWPLRSKLIHIATRLQGLAGSVRFGDGEDVLRLQAEIRKVSNWLEEVLRSHDAVLRGNDG